MLYPAEWAMSCIVQWLTIRCFSQLVWNECLVVVSRRGGGGCGGEGKKVRQGDYSWALQGVRRCGHVMHQIYSQIAFGARHLPANKPHTLVRRHGTRYRTGKPVGPELQTFVGKAQDSNFLSNSCNFGLVMRREPPRGAQSISSTARTQVHGWWVAVGGADEMQT